MECNKDEAVRAKEIAEKKFNAKDIAGAKKFALKAHALYPALEGIAQMLATFDVYLCAEKRTNGEADWYGILGVPRSADDETVRKHYRKLALTLHPDKNKSIGAEGAFKFVSAAWSLLSDQSKRAAYDQRVPPRVFERKAATPDQGPSHSGANGFHNFVETAFSGRRGNEKNPQGNTSNAPHRPAKKAKSNTFWTVCPKCKMQYEYLSMYANHNLLCPNCRQPFLAKVASPPSFSNSSKASASSSQQKRSSKPGSEGFKDVSGAGDPRWTPFSRGKTSNVAQAATVVMQTYEKVKREREEALAAKRREKTKRKFQPSDYVLKRATGEVGSGHTNKHRKFEKVQINGTNRSCNLRLLSQTEIHDILMQKARTSIRNIMSQYKSAGLSNNVVREGNSSKKTHHEKVGEIPNDCNLSPCVALPEHLKERSQSLSIDVPDPDFYNFDKTRTEGAFEENQVWAAYDDADGMPRNYAIIHAVLSRDPFKVRISWLNSKTNTELGSLDWLGCGFPKTCGDFRIGRHETNSSLNTFSHKVMFTKGARGTIHIYPKEGDVWALYRNWSTDWNELTSNDIIHKYDMVEVLDFDGGLGVVVIPLVKVAGFRTVFRQHLDRGQVQRIPRGEMFRFSHQVPCHLLTRQEASDTLKGCVELDPAATSVDLLHVIAYMNGEAELNSEEPTEKDINDRNLKRSLAEKDKVAGNLKKQRVVEVVEIE